MTDKPANKLDSELDAHIDAMLQREKTKRTTPAKSSTEALEVSGGVLTIRLGMLLLTIGLGVLGGFFGGLLSSRYIDSNGNPTTTMGQQVVLQESELIADVAERVSPSVVSIQVEGTGLRNSFFGPRQFETSGAGTGIIIDTTGLVVTNKHVVEDADSISITLSDDTTYDDVVLVGADPFNDIAFLQINNASNLVAAELGDSKEVRVGDKVIAIGNALGEFDTTVTAGIISGLGRPILAGDGTDADQLQNLFQTDTAINPGNSGGPLLNINGQVIGINTAVSGDAENIGFAIPINDVRPGIVSVKENGELIRPYLGVRYVTIDREVALEFELPVNSGALINSTDTQSAILRGSPAEKAGLQDGDIIIKVNGEELNRTNPLVTAVSQYQVGETITVTIIRNGNEQDVEVLLEAVPEAVDS